MAKTRGDLLYTDLSKVIGKSQIYALLVDANRDPVLDAAGNEQLVDLEVVAGRLQVDAAITGSLANVVTVSQTRPNNATPYTALDVVGTDAATNMEFATGLTAGSVIAITQAMLTIKVNAIPSGMSGFVAHLFNAAPTAITDNLAYNLIAADVAKYLGSITLNAPTDLGDNLVSDNPNLGKIIKLSTASVFVVLQTLAGYTPSASTVKDLTLAFVAV